MSWDFFLGTSTEDEKCNKKKRLKSVLIKNNCDTKVYEILETPKQDHIYLTISISSSSSQAYSWFIMSSNTVFRNLL